MENQNTDQSKIADLLASAAIEGEKTIYEFTSYFTEALNGGELGEQAAWLFHRLIEESDPRLRYLIHLEKCQTYISAPAVFIDLLKEFNRKHFKSPQTSDSGKYYFEGVEIIPGYEMAVVLFHEDYPKIGEKWMIKRINLNSHIPDRPDVPVSEPQKT